MKPTTQSIHTERGARHGSRVYLSVVDIQNGPTLEGFSVSKKNKLYIYIHTHIYLDEFSKFKHILQIRHKIEASLMVKTLESRSSLAFIMVE